MHMHWRFGDSILLTSVASTSSGLTVDRCGSRYTCAGAGSNANIEREGDGWMSATRVTKETVEQGCPEH